MSKRNLKTLGVWGPNGTRVVASEAMWKEPLRWNRQAAEQFAIYDKHKYSGGPAYDRPRVFCASLADVFEDWQGRIIDSRGLAGSKFNHDGAWLWGPDRADDKWNDKTLNATVLTMDDVRARLFRLIDATPNLDWLLLTKRPENIAKMMPPWRGQYVAKDNQTHGRRPNVWLGASCENQEQFDKRAIPLLRHNAAVSFLSLEPLLGPISIRGFGTQADPEMMVLEPRTDRGFWVIIGGESGHGARPCNVEWIRDIVRQCKTASVKVFVKQWGSNPVDESHFARATEWFKNHWGFAPTLPNQIAECQLKLRDKKGGDPAEWSEDLRVREFPAAK